MGRNVRSTEKQTAQFFLPGSVWVILEFLGKVLIWSVGGSCWWRIRFQGNLNGGLGASVMLMELSGWSCALCELVSLSQHFLLLLWLLSLNNLLVVLFL